MNSETRITNLIHKLRNHGYRVTPQRVAIINTLVCSDSHPSVEQVYEQVRINFPMTSLATVYKTVAMLKEVGEIQELSFGGESSRYDATTPHSHPHLICTKCHRILDPDVHLFQDLSNEIAEKYGFKITSERMDFFGICPECQQARFTSASRRIEV